MSGLRITAWISLGVLVCGICTVLLWPTRVDADVSPHLERVIRALQNRGFGLVTYARIEFVANVVMFVPLGFLLAFASRNPAFSLMFGVALSACGELAQSRFLPDRVASLRDVLANSTGTALGVSLALLLTFAVSASARARSERPTSDRRLA